MEYGVFLEPSFNWVLIKASIVCAILFVSLLSIFLSFNSITKAVSRGYRKRYETKTALLGSNAAPAKNLILRMLEYINQSTTAGWIVGIFMICSFIAIWPLLGIGLWKGETSNDCSDQKYASNGMYEVIDTKLGYAYDSSRIPVAKDDPRITSGEYNYYTDQYDKRTYLTEKTAAYYINIYTPRKPDHYQLLLEGKIDPSLPVTINRCVIIPYDQLSENQKFSPPAQRTQGIYAPSSISVSTPSIIEKHGDKWWKFTE